jgi:hypothetical protein
MSLFSMAPLEVSEKQVTKIRANWKRISRFGMPFFVLTFGTVLVLWICLCFAGFTYLYGTQKVLRDPFVIKSTLPCAAFLSYFFAVIYYLIVKVAVGRVEEPHARGQGSP